MQKTNDLNFDTYEAASEWFNTNDIADYEQRLLPVEFHFDLRKDRHWVELEHNLAQQVRAAARRKGISTRALVNQWLSQMLSQ